MSGIEIGSVWINRATDLLVTVDAIDDIRVYYTINGKRWNPLIGWFTRMFDETDIDVRHEYKDEKPKHSHYHKGVSDYQTIDVYAVCKIFDVQDTSGCLQHAIKKLLVTGQRGHKDRQTDIQNAIDTLNRLLELEHD